MAQHISIIQNKIYPDVQESIIKRFSKKNIGLGSFRYKELQSSDYKLKPTDRVFLNERKLKGKEEVFEIHFNTEQNQILDIYLVK